MRASFGLRSSAREQSWPRTKGPWAVLWAVFACLWGGPALAQTAPAPTLPRTPANPPRSTPAPAKPRQRPGSRPTPPVRYISPDPRDPQGPPPPGAINPGQNRVPGTSHKPVPDTLAPGRPGTGLVQGVSGAGDSLNLAAGRKGQIETTVKYAAKDSIQFDVGNKIARLYSKATVDYGTMNLKAALITVNYGTNTVVAEGRLDSVSNRLQDRPVFKDKDGVYTAGRIAYNFKTKKGKIAEAVTQQGEGYVSAETIKKMPGNELYGLHGRYTTCNLEHPHFYIQASKMKVVPGEKVVTGPFNLVIGDVPTPLGFLFGYFPTPNKSRGSGILIPTFGQAADRGYFLTNGGYYFAPNDYIGVRLTGDVYAGNAQSFGGWGATADVTYLKRYAYNGNFNFRFTDRPANRILSSDALSTSPEYIRPPSDRTFWLSWSHTPVPKPGGGRFTASVQAGSSSFNRQNSTLNARQYLSPSFNSSISYSKQLRNLPINYNVRLSQSQNTQTGVMDFTLPDISVGVARQYPYEWLGLEPRGRFYEQFTISYNLIAQNRVSNVMRARQVDGGLPLLGGTSTDTQIPLSFRNLGSLLRNAQNGMQHQFGIVLGSYNVAKYFKVQPSVNYGETWYGQRLDYKYIEAARAVRIDTVRGFHREYSYSAGLSLNTAFYGTVVRRGNRKIQALRHKATPSLNYNFSPDLSQNTSAYQNVTFPGLTDASGRQVTDRTFNRYAGFVYGVPGGQRVSQLSFALQNSVEMKVRNNNDSTGTSPFKKVSLLDGLDFNMGYNFAADSLRLSPLAMTFRTQVAQKLSIVANATLEPYQRDSMGRAINRYLFEQSNRRLLRLSSATLGLNYAFNPASGTKKSTVRRNVAPANDPLLGTPGPPAFYADYVDFDIPWELAMTYNASYTTSRPLRPGQARPPLLSASTIGFTGSVRLTENLRLSYTAGYDMVSKNITYPNITFYRDLHCWQITGMWIPFGQLKGYNFTIAAKSSLLQDLKLNRNRQQQFQ
ncbi:putative LPS assembly protein LptD [Hymenobacter saemangeumensis]|uniref:LPS assembly protein LptD n=1 Tax=Hymenobacter saemangeumensis TaxID=1084522 RepID=A0ABP8IF33_9BACT